MPDYPPAALRAAADAIERELLSGTDYVMAQDSDEALARVALDAAMPFLGEHAAAKILAHMEAHGPRPGSRTGGKPAGDAARRAWRRHLGIAARIAARAFLTEEDEKRIAAAALARGDYVACELPEERR
jgi:hypothetical protein